MSSYKGRNSRRNKRKDLEDKENNVRSKDYKESRNKKYDKGSKDPKVQMNEVEWTFPNPELAEQITQLSFQNFQGYGNVNGYHVPTIMRIDLMPSPGITKQSRRRGAAGTDMGMIASNQNEITSADYEHGRTGANVAATKLYSLLSSFTGRTSSYQPNDVLMMLLAISSFCEVSEAARRVFGVSLTFNPRNRTLAKDLIASMNIDPDDFFANASIYRMEFNALIARINQVPLLDNIGFIKKSRDIFQYIYTDANTNMAQYFYYMPACAWVINEEDYNGGTALVTHSMFKAYKEDGKPTAYSHFGPNELAKFSGILEVMKVQIDQLLNSTTLNLIYADLLNMSHKISTPLWTFDYLAENYTVLPMYNENALLQLHNLDVIGGPKYFVAGDCTPDENGLWAGYTEANNVMSEAGTGDIIYNPMFSSTVASAMHLNKVVDMQTDNPDYKMRGEALRYSAMLSGKSVHVPDGQYWSVSPALPDHYAYRAVVYEVFTYRPLPEGYYDRSLESDSYFQVFSTSLALDASTQINLLNYTKFSQFTGAPICYAMGSDSSRTDYLLGDLEYYTTVDYNYLRRVNNYAFQNLFDFRAK